MKNMKRGNRLYKTKTLIEKRTAKKIRRDLEDVEFRYDHDKYWRPWHVKSPIKEPRVPTEKDIADIKARYLSNEGRNAWAYTYGNEGNHFCGDCCRSGSCDWFFYFHLRRYETQKYLMDLDAIDYGVYIPSAHINRRWNRKLWR